MRKLRIAALGVLACLLLSACGQDGNNAPEPGGPAVTNSSPSEGATSSAQPGQTPSEESVTPSAGQTTLTGTVVEGVEPGCRLLDDYLLVGGPQDVLRAGARVTVTGRVQTDLMTTCQQGTPFLVESARPA